MKKKVFAIICIMIVALATVSAQGAKETTKDITDITVMVYERGATIAGGSTLDNKDTRWLNEQLASKGVHLTFVGV